MHRLTTLALLALWVAACSGPAQTDAATDASDIIDVAADAPFADLPTTYSDAYPPLPQLTNASGGPVLTHPTIYLVFYPNDPYATMLQTFAQRFTSSSFWAATTHEYGVGPIAYGGTIQLTQMPPTTIASPDVEAWVAGEIQTGAFGTPDPQGIYTIVYPQSTTITQPNPILPALGSVSSCVAFGGYHSSAQVTAGDGGTGDGGTAQRYAFAVIATCSSRLSDLTSTMSHEWVEASTDPFYQLGNGSLVNGGPNSAYYSVDTNHAVWGVLGGGEAGDLCEPEGASAYFAPVDLGYTVQRTWSNLAAMGGHDPCVPYATPLPYFNSSPVLPESVVFTSPITGSVTTQGVTIPIRSSRIIEVDLFSDADTGRPWTVRADDLLYLYYASYGVPNTLQFEWDRTQGSNGDALHLKITVLRQEIIGNGHAFLITSTLGARTTVWPGMVVE